MEVIILAGGLGTRLRSEVSDRPKCMAEINSKPFLYYWLKYLERFDIKKIILSLGYMSSGVESWVEDNHKNFNFLIDFVVEQQPLGTGGAIRFALNKTTQKNVLILNGDSFFMMDLENFCNKHKQKKASISLALKEMESFDRYGSVVIDENEKVTTFKEKTFCSKGLINAGIYMINKEKVALNNYPEKFSFEKDILQQSKDIFGFVCQGYFIDIGIPDDYHRAQKDFKTLFSDNKFQ